MQEAKQIPVIGKAWAHSSRHAIIDLGIGEEAPRRAETLVALGLPRKRNFSPWIQGRLVARVPLGDLPILVAAGAPISEGGSYYQTTHRWTGLLDGEDMAPASCEAYDREEAERREAECQAAGSRVFNDWKYWHWGTREVSKALGGIRRYGIRTEIPLSVIARTHGIGQEVVKFIDRCPEWQREAAYQACRTVAIEAAERSFHLLKGRRFVNMGQRCLDEARRNDDPGHRLGLIDQSKASQLYRADPASMASYSALQACFSTLHQWMRTGTYNRGEEMMWPMSSVCHSARAAHGYAALGALGIEPAEDPTTMDVYHWGNKGAQHPAYLEAARAEGLVQVERLCELTDIPRPMQ